MSDQSMPASSSSSKKPSRSHSGQKLSQRTQSSKSIERQNVATVPGPTSPGNQNHQMSLPDAARITTPQRQPSDSSPATIAGMTFLEGSPSSATLEDLRRRVEEVQLGKARSPESKGSPRGKDIVSKSRNPDNIATRRALADQNSSAESSDDLSSGVQSLSTESGKTVRGENNVFSPAAVLTPSYPFPRVPHRLSRGPSQMSTLSHKPFTLLSPTNAPVGQNNTSTPLSTGGIESDISTPAQNQPFAPSRLPSSSAGPSFSGPNLYDIVLSLSSEPGLEAWWSNVVHILQDHYGAERASLAIPGDMTDLENVPWGQKATFNAYGTESPDSPTFESSVAPSESSIRSSQVGSGITGPRFELSALGPGRDSSRLQPQTRPSLDSRHSFAGHQVPERPKAPPRALSHYTNLDAHSVTNAHSLRDLKERPTSQSHNPISKDGQVVAVTDTTSQTPLAVVYRIPQPLESEEDPLLLRTGVVSLFGRSKPVVLTREYIPRGHTQGSNSQNNDRVREGQLSEAQRRSNERERELANSDQTKTNPGSAKRINEAHRPFPTAASRQHYEEYEQPEPSPWSQSPAPSPAARPDPEESPFFASNGKIDETAFEQDPPNYDYSQTEPLEAIGADTSQSLIHIPLVQYVSPYAKSSSSLRFPMAILSMLTSLNPYPRQLRHSLSYLLPHLAASFSLAQQYSALETRMSGMPGNHYVPGFGLGGTFSDESSELELVAELSGQIAQGAISAHSSLHSPSGSAASRESGSSSLVGTPAMDAAAWGGFSPGISVTPGRTATDMVDSYFTAKRNRPATSHAHSHAPRSAERAENRRPSIDDSPVNLRSKKGKAGPTPQNTSKAKSGAPRSMIIPSDEKSLDEHEGRSISSTELRDQGRQMSSSTIWAARGGRDPASRPLPDLISQLMLNSVPLQLFLAKPKTGELLWTNTRFQVFRSQDATQRVKDPWINVHPQDIDGLIDGWKKVLKSGTQFTMHIRVKRFNNDSDYRWFIFRASTLLSQTGHILYFIGSFMDVHEQHLAELQAAEEKEISARDAKYRALANSIPQILFEAVENQGIVSANDQWHVYSGQSLEDAINLGFARHIHRDDLVKCGVLLPSITTSDPTNQDFTLSFTDQQAQDTSTMTSESSTSTVKTLQAVRPGDRLPQSSKPPTLDELVRDGVISVQDDERGRPSYSIEIRLKSKGGEFRWFLVRLVKVDSLLLNGGRASWYGTCTDIHDRKNLERELNLAMLKLNKEMESKTRFFANMSHEIRTPLNGILGSIPWLLESEIDLDQRRTLDTIHNSSNNLRELVDNILDVTKVEAGKMTLVHRWFHIRTLLEDTIDTISSRAIDRGLELNYTVDLEVPHTVKGDAFRLRQVLINLIGNAVKFTEQGEIYAHCSIRKEAGLEANTVMLAFDVTDTGKGFTNEDAQRLFKQFGQIESSNTQHEAGTGLGLFLSKQLVEMHGGHLTATGEEGKGATFSFSVKVGLPTANDQPVSPQAPRPKRKISSLAGALPPSPGGSLIQREGLPSPGSRPLISPGIGSPGPLSAASSAPSLRSAHYLTDRSTPSSLIPTPDSTNSFHTSKLTSAMAPSERLKLAEMAMAAKPVVEGLSEGTADLPIATQSLHPTTFSIVIICPAKYARNAFKQHIEQVVPHEIAANVTTMAGIDEWVELFKGPSPPVFTHVVLDIPDSLSINMFMQHIVTTKLPLIPELVIITDHYQKREIVDQQKSMLDAGLKVYLVTTPVKPSVFALIFDPAQLRNLSKDRGRDMAQAKAEDFKNVTARVKDTIGDKGLRILVVEDSEINRQVSLLSRCFNQDDADSEQVILKYLARVKVDSETATNGLECTQKILSKGLDYYALIIVCEHTLNIALAILLTSYLV